MSLKQILSLPYTIVIMPYNYLYGNQPKDPCNEEIETGWENIKTDAEVAKENRDKITQVTDKAFMPPVETQKKYSYDELKGSGRKDPVDRLLVPFKHYGPENPYLRRADTDLVPAIYTHSVNYQRDMGEKIVERYLSKEGRTPMEHLSQQLAQKNPRALQVAAVLHQLGDDSSCLPPASQNPTEMMQLQGQIVITPVEQGKVHFELRQGKNLEFTIKGDVIVVSGNEGELIKAYQTTRTVTVGYPRQDDSVECKISTVCDKVYEISDV